MPLNKTLLKVTDRIIERSKDSREKYVGRMKSAVERGRSINLAISRRGVYALECLGLSKKIMKR